MSSIILTKATKKQIISQQVDTIIRIGEINRWISSTIHELREFHLDEEPINVIILSSTKIKLTDLTESDLKTSEFSSLFHFKEYWEDTLMSAWNSKTFIWLVRIAPHEEENQPETDIADFFA